MNTHPNLTTYRTPEEVTDWSGFPQQVLLRRSIYDALHSAGLSDLDVARFFWHHDVHSYDNPSNRIGSAFLDRIPERVWVDACLAQKATTRLDQRIHVEDGGPLPSWLVEVINHRPGASALALDHPGPGLLELQLIDVDWFTLAEADPDELTVEIDFDEAPSVETVREVWQAATAEGSGGVLLGELSYFDTPGRLHLYLWGLALFSPSPELSARMDATPGFADPLGMGRDGLLRNKVPAPALETGRTWTWFG